jgi:hypothetical protein
VNDEKKILKDIKAKIMQKKAKVKAANAIKAKKKKARQDKNIKREKVLFIVWVWVKNFFRLLPRGMRKLLRRSWPKPRK